MEGTGIDLPTGTVTFLFSDIEGSTRLVGAVGPEVYRGILERHHAVLRSAFADHGGAERGTQGDSFLVVFSDAAAAVSAAVDGQRALASESWPDGVTVRVRMGLLSGQAIAGGDDYVGIDIHRAARIAGVAHGGQVLVSDATRALVERELPEGVSFIDLGVHELRDLGSPERLFQLVIDGLPSDFPPLATAARRPGNLPERMTSLIGREADLAAMESLLAGSRLVTIIGPGGTGKTSLGIEVARRIGEAMEDGAWLVALDAIAEPHLVATAIVTALDLRGFSSAPAHDRLIENLSRRELLLVLDNFEHVTAASGLVTDIVAAAPGVRVIVTSRSPLHIAAEQLYPLAPLALPESTTTDVEALAAVESTRLFVDRVRRLRPGFVPAAADVGPIVDICRRLDGLPLAIELAAAKVPLLGLGGVRDRLAARLPLPGPTVRDAPQRQRTLRDAVTWSYDQLEPPARELFARMAVFTGGCRADELESVCGSPDARPGLDVLETVAGLVDQSLVMTVTGGDSARFEMLETIRSVAGESFLELDDRADLERRHARAYLALAETAAPAMPGRHQTAALDLLGPERDNLRTAIAWAVANADADTGLRMGAALTWFWGLRGEIEEARTALASLLAMPGADAPTRARMRALEAAGTIDYYGGKVDHAAELYAAQLALARELEDPLGTADALFNIPFTRPLSEGAALAPLLEEAEALYRSIGQERGLARISWARGAGLALAGRIDEGMALWQDAFEQCLRLDDVTYQSLAASSLGVTYAELGDREAAGRWFLTALEIDRGIGDVVGMTLALPIAAAVAIEIVGPEPAATMLGAYEVQTRRYGVKPPPGLAEVIAQGAAEARTRAAMDERSFEDAYDRGRRMTPEEASDFVMSLVGRIGAELHEPPAGAFGGSEPA